MTETNPKKKKFKKAKWLSEEVLQKLGEKKRKKEKRSERQKRKGKLYLTECRVPQKSKE